VNGNPNDRGTAARKLEGRPDDAKKRSPLETADAGDKPKRSYGLTEGSDDRGASTRHYDGRIRGPNLMANHEERS
jgi:hypothetical protein